MAGKPPLSDALADLIAQLEPELANAFLDAMFSLRGGVDFIALQDALARNDVDAAIGALDIEPGAFSPYVTARASGFTRSGVLASAYIPTHDAGSVNFRFDMTNPRAERWIRDEAATRVVGYTQEQTATARRVILDGYGKGQGPQQIAVDIAGRIDRTTGRRAGGIIGLSDPQASYVQSMRERLGSGDPSEMRKVLGQFDKAGKWISGTGMTLRDRRYDGVVKRAIKAGKPVAQDDVDKLAGLYADRLLKKRAADVARTETAQSVMGARAESYRQAMEKEGLPNEAIKKIWRHLGAYDDNARVQHEAMNDKEVVGLNMPFTLPDGTQMQFAHDPAGGAKHNIGCRCDTFFELDFLWGL